MSFIFSSIDLLVSLGSCNFGETILIVVDRGVPMRTKLKRRQAFHDIILVVKLDHLYLV